MSDNAEKGGVRYLVHVCLIERIWYTKFNWLH